MAFVWLCSHKLKKFIFKRKKSLWSFQLPKRPWPKKITASATIDTKNWTREEILSAPGAREPKSSADMFPAGSYAPVCSQILSDLHCHFSRSVRENVSYDLCSMLWLSGNSISFYPSPQSPERRPVSLMSLQMDSTWWKTHLTWRTLRVLFLGQVLSFTMAVGTFTASLIADLGSSFSLSFKRRVCAWT